MRTHTPQGGPRVAPDGGLLPRLGERPPGLAVDPRCPDCGSDAWRCVQIVGETPGIPTAPAAGGGVRMQCDRCAFEAEYRATAPGAEELARRTARLWEDTPR